MKKFAAKLLLFVAVFLIFDKLFIIIANLSADAEIDKRLEYLINGEINKDIIIMGASRGSRDIIASQIEKETGFSAYNLCYPGSNVEFHEFIMRALIKFNSTPRLVFLVVDDNAELLYDETITFRKDRLYPLVKYSFIRQELINIGEKDPLLSRFLILHQLNKANFDLTKKYFTPVDTIYECGSMPISWQREISNWHYDSSERIYPFKNEHAEKINAYKNIIKICNLNNINLVIVFPPSYKKPSESFEKRIRELSGNVNYYFYDNENPIYRNKDYYYDESHLMRNGAIIFTDELNSTIKDLVYIKE